MSRTWRDVLASPDGHCEAQVVFIDIEKYSKRSSQQQRTIIELLGSLVRQALADAARESLPFEGLESYVNERVLKIPTGDGMALVFSEGSPVTIGLRFSEEIMAILKAQRDDTPCRDFATDRFCDCHDVLAIRCGIAFGSLIAYEDINGSVNVAGQAINEAARLMDLADPSQVLVSLDVMRMAVENARQRVDRAMFIERRGVRIKHGIRLDVYQYAPFNSEAIRHETPLSLIRQISSKAPRGVHPRRLLPDGVPPEESPLAKVHECDLREVARLYHDALVEHSLPPSRAIEQRLGAVREFYRANSDCFRFIVMDSGGEEHRVGFTCVLPLRTKAFNDYRAGELSEWELCRTYSDGAPVHALPQGHDEPARHILIQSINIVKSLYGSDARTSVLQTLIRHISVFNWDPESIRPFLIADGNEIGEGLLESAGFEVLTPPEKTKDERPIYGLDFAAPSSEGRTTVERVTFFVRIYSLRNARYAMKISKNY